MKKTIILSAVAIVAMVGCAKVQDTYVGAPESREIAFQAVTQPNTRGVIKTATFPTTNTMEVAAYDATKSANHFTKTTFTYQYLGGATDATNNPTHWGGNTPRYWPLSAATINFFAVSGDGVNNADIAIDNDLAKAEIMYKTTGNTSSTAYSETSQVDILYASQRAAVTQSGNTLTIPSEVGMTFGHAFALVNFQIKGSTAISIKKIVLNGAHYTGKLTLNNTNASAASGAISTQVNWEPDAVVEGVKVPNIGNETTPVALTASYVPANPSTIAESDTWACLMIVPSTQAATPTNYGFTSFTIHYVVNNIDYTYTYAPTLSGTSPALTAVTAGYKYTYQIDMNLHEILVNPQVTPWSEQNSADNVTI